MFSMVFSNGCMFTASCVLHVLFATIGSMLGPRTYHIVTYCHNISNYRLCFVLSHIVTCHYIDVMLPVNAPKMHFLFCGSIQTMFTHLITEFIYAA